MFIIHFSSFITWFCQPVFEYRLQFAWTTTTTTKFFFFNFLRSRTTRKQKQVSFNALEARKEGQVPISYKHKNRFSFRDYRSSIVVNKNLMSALKAIPRSAMIRNHKARQRFDCVSLQRIHYTKNVLRFSCPCFICLRPRVLRGRIITYNYLWIVDNVYHSRKIRLMSDKVLRIE